MSSCAKQPFVEIFKKTISIRTLIFETHGGFDLLKTDELIWVYNSKVTIVEEGKILKKIICLQGFELRSCWEKGVWTFHSGLYVW